MEGVLGSIKEGKLESNTFLRNESYQEMRLGLWTINIRNPILVKIYTIIIQTLLALATNLRSRSRSRSRRDLQQIKLHRLFDLRFACMYCHGSCLVCHGCIIRPHVKLDYEVVINLNCIYKAALLQSLTNYGSS